MSIRPWMTIFSVNLSQACLQSFLNDLGCLRSSDVFDETAESCESGWLKTLSSEMLRCVALTQTMIFKLFCLLCSLPGARLIQAPCCR